MPKIVRTPPHFHIGLWDSRLDFSSESRETLVENGRLFYLEIDEDVYDEDWGSEVEVYVDEPLSDLVTATYIQLGREHLLSIPSAHIAIGSLSETHDANTLTIQSGDYRVACYVHNDDEERKWRQAETLFWVRDKSDYHYWKKRHKLDENALMYDFSFALITGLFLFRAWYAVPLALFFAFFGPLSFLLRLDKKYVKLDEKFDQIFDEIQRSSPPLIAFQLSPVNSDDEDRFDDGLKGGYVNMKAEWYPEEDDHAYFNPIICLTYRRGRMKLNCI